MVAAPHEQIRKFIHSLFPLLYFTFNYKKYIQNFLTKSIIVKKSIFFLISKFNYLQ